MDMRIPPLNIKILLESNPLKPRILVGRLGVQLAKCPLACSLACLPGISAMSRSTLGIFPIGQGPRMDCRILSSNWTAPQSGDLAHEQVPGEQVETVLLIGTGWCAENSQTKISFEATVLGDAPLVFLVSAPINQTWP